MKITIVIPAYNEEKRIGNTLNEYSSFFEKKRRKKEIDYQILVAINNTSDKTEEVVKKCKVKNGRIKYINLVKGGKGYAVIEGFKKSLNSENDLIGFVDADMATSPLEYYRLIKSVDRYDAAIASRYLPGSRVFPAFTFRRLVVGRIFNLFVRLLFLIPYTDTQCGAKLFSTNAIEVITENVKTSQWAFDVEMLYLLHRKGMKIKEVPTIWREMEESKLNIVKASVQMFFAILRLRIIKSPLKRLLLQLKPLMGVVWRLTK